MPLKKYLAEDVPGKVILLLIRFAAAVNFRQIKLSNKADWIIHWDWDQVLSNRDSQPEDATRTW